MFVQKLHSTKENTVDQKSVWTIRAFIPTACQAKMTGPKTTYKSQTASKQVEFAKNHGL